MIRYNRTIGVKHGNSDANRTINKTTLLIINPLTCFGSLHSQKQYDVTKKFFLTN